MLGAEVGGLQPGLPTPVTGSPAPGPPPSPSLSPGAPSAVSGQELPSVWAPPARGGTPLPVDWGRTQSHKHLIEPLKGWPAKARLQGPQVVGWELPRPALAPGPLLTLSVHPGGDKSSPSLPALGGGGHALAGGAALRAEGPCPPLQPSWRNRPGCGSRGQQGPALCLLLLPGLGSRQGRGVCSAGGKGLVTQVRAPSPGGRGGSLRHPIPPVGQWR